MKKIKIVLISIMLFLSILAMNVYAVSNTKINISIPQEARVGDLVKLTLKIENTDEKISGIQGKVEYNKDILEYVENKTLVDGWFVSGFNKDTGIFLAEVTNISDNSKYISGTKDVLEFTFRIKDNVKAQETNVGISGIVLSGAISANKEVMKSVQILADEENNNNNNNNDNNNTGIEENNNDTENENINNNNNDVDNRNDSTNDTSKKNEILPNTGVETLNPIIIFGIVVVAFILYLNIRKYKGI